MRGNTTSSVGYPEKALARLSSDTVFIALQGTTERGVFELVNQYPGSPMADLAQGVGHPQSRIRAIVGAFDSAELMEVLDARPYLAKPGRNKAAHRDRMHANVIHRRFGIYTDPSSTYRLQQRNHDADAGRLVAHCSTADISHGAGWRLEIISSNGTQLRPDLYVLIPRGDGYGVWHAFELERSAFSSSAIALKSNPSRVARDEGEPWPYLWATGKGGRGTRAENHDREAARRFNGDRRRPGPTGYSRCAGSTGRAVSHRARLAIPRQHSPYYPPDNRCATERADRAHGVVRLVAEANRHSTSLL